MSVNFDSYKVFYYVAKCHNITTAANALYLTQPTVSHAISSLEKNLGCQLFIRSKKGVSLTTEGELLYEHISLACEHIWEGEQLLRQHLTLEEGLVRIGAGETTLHHFLLPYLEQFKSMYPNIRLKIWNTAAPVSISDLKKGLIDFAVIISPEPEPGLVVTPVCSLQDVFIAGNHFEELKKRKLHMEELISYPLVCMEKGTATREHLEHLFRSHQCELIPDIELATTDLITPMVAHNLGIGFVPYAFAEHALADGTVFSLDLEEELPHRHICLVSDAQRPLSVASSRLFQLIFHQVSSSFDGK